MSSKRVCMWLVLVALACLVGRLAAGAEPEGWVTYPFNGKNLDGWKAVKESANRWQVGKAEVDPQNPGQLVVKPGGSDLVNVVPPRTYHMSDLESEARWGDCRIEIEVMVPEKSNSGIFVMGTEIQVLDGINLRTGPKSNMGAIYGRRGPSYFPEEWLSSPPQWNDPKWVAWMKSDEYTTCVSKVLKPPGEWQKFVIEIELSRTDPATNTTTPARFRRVELNGVVIHENVELRKNRRSPGGLMLQGNHGPVAYRNIKITPLEGEKHQPNTGATQP